MVEMTAYAPGTPSWVDISTPDMEATKTFYSGLFGWERTESDPVYGGYANFLLNGKMVCGATPTMSPNQHPAWSTYIATADADATAEKVQANGGQVVFPPMDVAALGRMAVFTDPTGAMFGAWQAGEHKGAAVVNEPGAVGWTHLLTRDMPAANAFYPNVFGWTAEMMGDDAVWTINGRPIAGGHAVGEEFPQDAPSNWLVHFVVLDCDATVTKARELGGELLMPPMDSPYGRIAPLADPHGAVFAIVEMQQ